MTIRVGINGYGRIGRNVLRALYEGKRTGEVQIVALNDLCDSKTNAHLTRYDTVHGRFDGEVKVDGDQMVVNGDRIRVFAERDPAKLPWGEVGAEFVLECTGLFTSKAKASAHLKGGAKKVVISAPGGEDVDATIVYGVNHNVLKPGYTVISNASCTTNCLATTVKVLHDSFGIERGMMTTVHSYTNDQKILDVVHKDLRRARAAAINIIPTSSGVSKALAQVIPDLKGKFDCMSLRVPTPTVSICDFTAVFSKSTSAEEINAAFQTAAEGKLKGLLGITEEPLVSSDFRGDERSSIVDGLSTTVMDGTFAKVLAWYDNEWGYACRVADLAQFIGERM